MHRKFKPKGISPRVVGRLSLYRRALHNLAAKNVTNVFSTELANLANVTCSQVRQDLMGIDYNGTPQFGYEVAKLQRALEKKMRSDDTQKLLMLGAGHLGKAILQFFQQNHPNIKLVATLDIDPKLIGHRLNGVPILPVQQLETLVISEQIPLAILAVPTCCAQNLADRLSAAGVRSILNFSTVRLHVPEGVFVENNDIGLSLERIAFFGRRQQEVNA